MDIHVYPGQGLSLSQLVFALNEELKRVTYCSSFTFDYVSQLDRDTLTALATIREWRNSFVPINRIPPNVLSLIPTHLSRVGDLFRATAVCRHWRRILIQHAPLWSRLELTFRRDYEFAKTLLDRTKGSVPLDISSPRLGRANILALLSPHAQRFRSLKFLCDHWLDIEKFSQAVSGPLPFLRALEMDVVEHDMQNQLALGTPSLPLFSGAVNLEEFSLYSEFVPCLNHFNFPNLTTFKLKAVQMEFPISKLLDFLKASPALQSVRIALETEVDTGDVPPERVVVLPNVKIFTVIEEEPGFNVATYISCPSAKHVSLIHEREAACALPDRAFSTSAPRNSIVSQYMTSPIDEVILSILTTEDLTRSCSISFISPGPAILKLDYRETSRMWEEFSLGGNHSKVFSRACMIVRNHLRLCNIRRLCIKDFHTPLPPSKLAYVAEEAIQLFKSVGSLEELTLNVVDLRPYLAPFLGLPGFQDTKGDAFPAIKELTITGNLKESLKEKCMAAVVEWAKSQHASGVPFERMTFRMKDHPVAMVERLRSWVGTVCFGEMEKDSDDDFLGWAEWSTD